MGVSGPLAGIRVIDITIAVLGPVATQLLGDMGAEVIKIETPEGDPMRQIGPARNPGMAAYYLKAWNLWATHRMRRFEVEYANGSGFKNHAALTELLAVRIRFFGNILRELVPGAHLDCPDLRAVMCRTDSRTAYLRYVAGALLGRHWNVDGIDLVSCSEVICKLPQATQVDIDGKNKKKDRVYVEADGELLGRLPARMSMQPDALSLVVPAAKN